MLQGAGPAVRTFSLNRTDSQSLASPSFVGVRSLADTSMKFASEFNFAFGTHCIGIHAADITQNPPWLLESPMDLSITENPW